MFVVHGLKTTSATDVMFLEKKGSDPIGTPITISTRIIINIIYSNFENSTLYYCILHKFQHEDQDLGLVFIDKKR